MDEKLRDGPRKVSEEQGPWHNQRGFQRPGTTDMGKFNILLVDDEQILATTLSHGLRKAMGKATSVAVCFSSSEALSLLAMQSFDVVISDLNTPGMSGLELLKQIRQDHRETILVLITAYGTDELEKEAHQLASGYITKPFELPLLVQLIRGLIRGKETGAEISNAPRILAPESNANPDPLRSKAFTDPGGSN